MKTLKITLLVLAVILLTVSGQSSDSLVETNTPTFKKYNKQNLLAVDKKKLKLESQG